MNHPQEHHCDLGLIEDDHTPLLTKEASARPAKNIGEADDQNNHQSPRRANAEGSTTNPQNASQRSKEQSHEA